jgi:hypothetical protein
MNELSFSHVFQQYDISYLFPYTIYRIVGCKGGLTLADWPLCQCGNDAGGICSIILGFTRKPGQLWPGSSHTLVEKPAILLTPCHNPG